MNHKNNTIFDGETGLKFNGAAFDAASYMLDYFNNKLKDSPFFGVCGLRRITLEKEKHAGENELSMSFIPFLSSSKDNRESFYTNGSALCSFDFHLCLRTKDKSTSGIMLVWRILEYMSGFSPLHRKAMRMAGCYPLCRGDIINKKAGEDGSDDYYIKGSVLFRSEVMQ